MKLRTPARAIVLFSLLTAADAATLGGGGDPRPLDKSQTFDFSSGPSGNIATYVASQADGKLKGIKRVAITNMCVQFINSKSAIGFSGAGTRAYTRTAESGIPGGLDEAKVQAVADGWLEQLEADFRAAGIEVVPYEELKSNELFSKYAAKYEQGIRVGAREGSTASKGDTGEVAVYVSPKGRPFAVDCGTISPISTSTFVRMSYPMNAEFLTVSAVIDLGQARASGGLLRGARADIDMVQHLRAGDSQFQFIGKMGPGTRLWLKQSIVPPQNPFNVGAEASKDFKGSTDDQGRSLTLTTTTTRSVGFDEDLYYRNAAESLRAMHQMFIGYMTSHR